MPRPNIILDDFSSGHISPLLEGRIDSEDFKSGLSECINMFPDPRGPVLGIPGWKHIGEIAEGDYSVLYEFTVSATEAYLFAFSDLKLAIYNATTEAVEIILDTLYTQEDLSGDDGKGTLLWAKVAPNGKAIYFTHNAYTQYKLVVDLEQAIPADKWTWEAVTFTGAPADWADGDFPTVVTFFQGRSWWAGMKKFPNRMYASKSGSANWEDMTTGTTADDGLQFDIDRYGRIVWLAEGKDLLIGTVNSEFVATSEGGVIQPGDIQVNHESSNGSKPVIPDFISRELAYISPDGRKLKTMWYKWLENGWISKDVTYKSEDITFSGIKRLCFARNPNSIAWCLLETEDLVGAYYLRESSEEPAIGWFTTESQMSITSAASIDSLGNSELWAIGRVEVEGVQKLHLMRKAAFELQTPDKVYLDNYKEYTFAEPTTTITGLDYLEGKTVHAVGDRAHMGSYVVQSGSIELRDGAINVVVGLQFRQYIKTLPLRSTREQGQGHQMKRWNGIWVDVEDSYLPLINGKRASERHATTLMDTGEPKLSEFVRATALGWDRKGQIEIEQDLPLELNIKGIYGEAATEQVG